MIIKLIFPDGRTQEYTFDKNTVVIGRSKHSDVVIPSDSISRKHLRFFKIGSEVYVEVVAKDNWIALNGKKIENFPRQLYFDTMKIQLPGKIKVSLSDPELEQNKMKKDFQKASESLQRKILRSVGVNPDGELPHLMFKFLRIAVPLACVLFIWQVYWDKKNKPKVVKKAKRVYETEKIPKNKIGWQVVRMKVSPNNFEEVYLKSMLIRTQKCGLKTQALCKFVFKGNRAPLEGIAKVQNNSFVITINIKTTALRIEQDLAKDIVKQLSVGEKVKFYIATQFITEKLMQSFKANAINDLIFIAYDFEGNDVEYLYDVVVPVFKIPKIDRSELGLIISEIQDRRKFDRFNEFFWWMPQ